MSKRRESEGVDYQAIIAREVLNPDSFLRLTLSGAHAARSSPWKKISVRPVEVQGRRLLQFSYFDGKKDTTANHSGSGSRRALTDALSIPFTRVHVQTTTADVHVRITRKGRALVTRGKPSLSRLRPDLSHDRAKSYPLAAGKPDDFLRAIGVTDGTGRTRGGMQAKFRQINEFLRIIDRTLPAERTADAARSPSKKNGSLYMVDCGCGSAHLTFAAYHYLNHVRGTPAVLVGVDRDRELVGKCTGLQQKLGWEGISFEVSAIAELRLAARPDVVFSLHACDTATDEAIMQGILWGSGAILCAPCCQHELHDQLRADVLRPMLRYGIMRERLADLVTDALRALILRIMGYRTSVVEFAGPEDTSKNLLIRAERGPRPGHHGFVTEYLELKKFCGVTPCLEGMLGEELRRYLPANGSTARG